MEKLSSIDRKILSILQEDARTKLDIIAAEADTSVATVQRKIRNMRENNIITGEVAQVAPEAIGYTMTFLILVELERETLHQLDNFKRKMKKDPQVQQCYYITGDADFALITLAKDMKDFQELTHRLFFEDANVKKFRSSVVMEVNKSGCTVPV